MQQDHFARSHPLVLLAFFAQALLLSLLQRGLLWSGLCALCAAGCYTVYAGRAALRHLALAAGLLLAITLVNPLFDSRGETVLFRYFGRAYTQQALLVGLEAALIFIAALIWFWLLALIMDSEKLISLLSRLAPSLSLLLVLVFRLIPLLFRKQHSTRQARQAIGIDRSGTRQGAGLLLIALLRSALQTAVIAAQSMRARGYGLRKRTHFLHRRFTAVDAITLLLITAGALCALLFPSVAVYCLGILLLPLISHLWEAIAWHFWKSRI